jgi:hypothetical protein
MSPMDIYILGVMQDHDESNPDVFGTLQPHARYWRWLTICSWVRRNT